MESVEIIMLPVTDQQKSKQFYLDLGFQVVVEKPGSHGEMWIQMGLPGGTTTIALSKFNGTICETRDIEAAMEELAAKGIDVGNVDDTPWGKFTWLKDPDGNRICLHQK